MKKISNNSILKRYISGSKKRGESDYANIKGVDIAKANRAQLESWIREFTDPESVIITFRQKESRTMEQEYKYMLNMDNSRFESCWVLVQFTTDENCEFIGFTSITSDKVLDSHDLAHLEEWVMQARGSWTIQILDNCYKQRKEAS